MRRIDTAKPFAFFLEFLLVLFFFALSSMVVLRIYAQSQVTQKEDHERLEALTYARNQVEDPKSLKEGTYGMNSDFSESGTYFTIVIEEDEQGVGSFMIKKGDEVLVTLSYYDGGDLQ